MHSNYIRYTSWLYTYTKVYALAIHSNYIKYTLGYIHTLKLHKVCALAIYIHSNYIKYTPWLYTYTQTT